MRYWWPVVVVGLLAGVLLGPTAADQYGAAAWRILKLWPKTWYVYTAEQLDAAIAECATYEVPTGSGETIGGRIIVSDWIVKDCTGEVGTCFEMPAVYQGTVTKTTLKAPCTLEAAASNTYASSSAGNITTAGIQCDDTSTMTAETIAGDDVKACLGIGGDGQIVTNLTIVTSDDSSADTVGILMRTPATAQLHCNSGAGACDPGERSLRAASLTNVSVRTEDTTNSGRGIAMAFVLGADVGLNSISGFSEAGIDFLDVGSFAFNNGIRIHSGRIQTTGVAVKCDSTYDSQQFEINGTVMESNGINVLLDTNCAANVTVNSYMEGNSSGTIPSTEGIKISGAAAGLDFSGTVGGTFTSAAYAFRRTVAPTIRPDTIAARFYSGTGVTYPATGGLSLNGGCQFGTTTPVDGSTPCSTGDCFIETDAQDLFFCADGTTNDWYGIQLVDTP